MTGAGREPGGPLDSGAGATSAFALIWPAALLIAMTAVPGWFGFVLGTPTTPRAIVEIAIVLFGLALVARPSGIAALAALAILQLAQAAFALPELPNHRWVVTLVNATLLASLIGGFSFPSFQSAARAVVVICYSFAFFAKLNVDFLDPATSCAGRFYGNVAGWLPLPDGADVRAGIAFVTLAIEGLLPLGLVVVRGRARVAVIALGFLFHLALSLDLGKHFVNFSAVMTGGLLLFLPHDSLADLGSRLQRWRVPAAVGLVVLLGLGFIRALGVPLMVPFQIWRHLVFVVPVVAILVLLPRLRELEERPRRLPSFAASVVVALALLNGLAPYLGLKTRTAFDMYSNLRLEAERSNHLVVPRSLDLLGLLGDRVLILQSDARGRQLGLEPGAEWPWFEVSRRLGRTPPPVVVYERGGERFIHDARRGSRVDPPPWLLRKLLVFRPLGERTRGLCLW